MAGRLSNTLGFITFYLVLSDIFASEDGLILNGEKVGLGEVMLLWRLGLEVIFLIAWLV